ncbi:MAG: polyprenyl synthetase family protein [Alphaproteobacteria bacterium]
MDAFKIVDRALSDVLAHGETRDGPPTLVTAMRYACFPGGARLRPRLVLAVAQACGNDDPELAAAAACAIELLHCASLVHDDLPCFDDADIRRGKPSIHKAFGEPLAVLTGDALIVLAFEALARGAARSPERLAQLVMTFTRGAGAPFGITAGQAWECEASINLSKYQQAKTGSLFAAATVAGAEAAGANGTPWRAIGEYLGEAYQVADDIRDVVSTPEELGKPIGQDELCDRPSAVREFGLDGAIAHLKHLVTQASESIPDCRGRNHLQTLIEVETKRFLPEALVQRAA